MDMHDIDMKDKIINVDIDKIKISKWDIRVRKEDPVKFEALMKSIDSNGLLHPLTVKQDNGNYILVAGRRRFKAIKQLGFKKVPVLVEDDRREESDLRIVTYLENVHRRNLEEFEKCYGLLSVYQSAGYTQDQAIEGTKSIDNWFSKNVGKNWKNLEEQSSSKTHKDTNPLRSDPKFIDVCRRIGWSPKYQYQILQKTRDLPKDVLALAASKGLSSAKTTMLTHSELRGHPKLQKKLVQELAEKQSDTNAKEKVYQTVNDLKTGAIDKVGQTYVRHDSFREDISKKSEKRVSQFPIQITGACKKLIFSMTNIPIRRGQIRYELEVFDEGREQMKDICLAAMDNELDYMESNLRIAKVGIEKMLIAIKKENDAREAKKDLISK